MQDEMNDLQYTTTEDPDIVKVVRCKDCKWLSMTTIGMPYACWHGAGKIFGETGEHANYTVCTRIESLDHFCSYGKREEKDA